MKPLPEIMKQKGPTCQTYAIVQLLKTKYNKKLDPEVLYNQVCEWVKEKDVWHRDVEPTVWNVLDYLRWVEILTGYDKQMIGRDGVPWYLTEKLALPRSIRIAKNICDSGGGIISVNVSPNVSDYPEGLLTEKIIKDNRLNQHALYLYDYDDNKRHFILVNSWGKDYGDGTGCLYLPYDILNKSNAVTTINYATTT